MFKKLLYKFKTSFEKNKRYLQKNRGHRLFSYLLCFLSWFLIIYFSLPNIKYSCVFPVSVTCTTVPGNFCYFHVFFQVICPPCTGWGARDPEEGPRQEGERDEEVHPGSHSWGPEVCREVGQDEAATGECPENHRAAATGQLVTNLYRFNCHSNHGIHPTHTTRIHSNNNSDYLGHLGHWGNKGVGPGETRATPIVAVKNRVQW